MTVHHTPGPWYIHTPGPWYIHRQALADIYADSLIASVYGSLDSLEQGEANARLIAAAPELLEACKAAIAHLDTIFVYYDANDAIAAQLQSAITKAEG